MSERTQTVSIRPDEPLGEIVPLVHPLYKAIVYIVHHHTHLDTLWEAFAKTPSLVSLQPRKLGFCFNSSVVFAHPSTNPHIQ